MNGKRGTAPCPNLTECGGYVAWGKILCYKCWSRVPEPLQRAVYRAWEARQAHPSTETREAHNEAVRAAIESVS